MDKKSSINVNINDNTVQTSGSQELRVIIPMLTTRGKLGLNRVTAQNYKDILGYDLEYNSNYYGLGEILSNVRYADVWRLNQGASCANAYLKDGEMKSETGVESVESLDDLDYTLAILKKDAGYEGRIGATIIPRPTLKVIPNKFENNLLTVTIDDVVADKIDSDRFIGYEDNVVFYDSSNSSVVAVVKDNKIYRVVSNVVDTSKEIGTVSGGEYKFTKQPNANASWVARYYSTKYEEWTLKTGLVDDMPDGSLIMINTKSYDFSLKESSDIFIDKVSFGDLVVINNDGINSSTKNTIGEIFELKNGKNGGTDDSHAIDNELEVVNVDCDFLKTSSANFIFMNGFLNENVINAIILRATSNKIHVFVDAPADKSYADTERWCSKISKNAYVVIGAKPEVVAYNDSYFYVFPSVKYCQIYANMLMNYGHLNYPPAGHSYGQVSATQLLETDYDYYGDELKTNRINYLVTEPNGTCIWEQRTNHPIDSDLSYIAPTFILDSLSDRLVSFERNFNFRYQDGTQLLVQDVGIRSILDEFVTNGFLYSYELIIPTVDEANDSRELNIYIGVKFMKDSEIINLNIALNN